MNPYWHHVGLYYEQLEGLIAGYNLAARDTNLTIPAGDLYWMNVQGDIEDLEQVGALSTYHFRLTATLLTNVKCLLNLALQRSTSLKCLQNVIQSTLL